MISIHSSAQVQTNRQRPGKRLRTSSTDSMEAQFSDLEAMEDEPTNSDILRIVMKEFAALRKDNHDSKEETRKSIQDKVLTKWKSK